MCSVDTVYGPGSYKREDHVAWTILQPTTSQLSLENESNPVEKSLGLVTSWKNYPSRDFLPMELFYEDYFLSFCPSEERAN